MLALIGESLRVIRGGTKVTKIKPGLSRHTAIRPTVGGYGLYDVTINLTDRVNGRSDELLAVYATEQEAERAARGLLVMEGLPA